MKSKYTTPDVQIVTVYIKDIITISKILDGGFLGDEEPLEM